ncbi:vitamin B12-dependent ribonucleotide reductase [Candidatus Uhrbacteria bacterium]|nr:vitamin B12-dependent ribonucleotide reductase [Candidatus Uhrbacteria bacterium]
MVELTLIDQNLAHVAKRFLAARFDRSASGPPAPIYGHGLAFERYFTKPGLHPFDELQWERRDARLTNEKGEVIFEQKEVEVPSFWSQTATNIVVQKYFTGTIGQPDREWSVRQLVTRVAHTIADWGRWGGYFATAEDAETFEMELTHILVNQKAAFNSPVWFNVGLPDRKQQCSACFIQSVQDDMHSILTLAVNEGMLFKYGSGTGTNLSSLRSSKEYLSHSVNKSSGPVSFMKAYDAVAGVVKSGGKTRRAAKMVILNIDHPDILEFIRCKAAEERKAWALIDAGYDGSIIGEAYHSVFFQNANNSVRVTDDFMRAVEEDGQWMTRSVTTGEPMERFRARELMKEISEAAWQCGDPGLQYDTTINRWHTTKKSGRINASNPCSEYMYLDDTACNLASLNLMKFRTEYGEFDTEAFRRGNETVITAMEIIVGFSSYPTPAIEQNSYEHRPLGIGYANLGSLLMARGLPYDSEDGRNFAAAVTALMSGAAYAQSTRIAEKLGPFTAFPENRESMMEVMQMHRDAAYQIKAQGVPEELLTAARKSWDEVVEGGGRHGLRNSQISVLAPTGTISFLMDCDTTGIEPDIALVKYKWLVGGGMLKLVNNTVPEALARLGYSGQEIDDLLAYLNEKDTIEGAPHLKEEHLAVFDCAFTPSNGQRSIHYLAHLRMMATTQPFISGAISKTVNMPQAATPDDIAAVYREGWKLGIKAIAIYRDGSKRQQPLTTSLEKDQSKKKGSPAPEVPQPRRRRLPDERRAITHKFSVGGHEGYLTVGLYDDGQPGEVFITMAKEGSVISGLMDSLATSVSIALQYGVPLKALVNKFAHMRFEPSGFTGHASIRMAKSVVDYIFRWMALKFLPPEDQQAIGLNVPATVEENAPLHTETLSPLPQPTLFAASGGETKSNVENQLSGLVQTFNNMADAPVCDTCGAIMVRNAACYKCLNCGSTSGCS